MNSLIIFILFVVSFTQILASDPLLNKVRDKVRGIKDFTAEATITLNVEFLKAKPSQARILYKSPGRLKIKSDGFSMLPKQGAGLPFADLLESPFTSVDLPDEMIKGISYKVKKSYQLLILGKSLLQLFG